MSLRVSIGVSRGVEAIVFFDIVLILINIYCIRLGFYDYNMLNQINWPNVSKKNENRHKNKKNKE